jgi:hypothetical protein
MQLLVLRRRRARRSTFSLVGWLFADLLLALTMIFVIISAVQGVYVPPKKVGVTPIISALSSKPVDVMVQVDTMALLNSDPAAMASVQSQVKSQLRRYSQLKAGMVLTFGGGPDANQDTSVAQQINAVLASLGAKHFVFDKAVYRSFIDLSQVAGTNLIEVYFFAYQSQ